MKGTHPCSCTASRLLLFWGESPMILLLLLSLSLSSPLPPRGAALQRHAVNATRTTRRRRTPAALPT